MLISALLSFILNKISFNKVSDLALSHTVNAWLGPALFHIKACDLPFAALIPRALYSSLCPHFPLGEISPTKERPVSGR